MKQRGVEARYDLGYGVWGLFEQAPASKEGGRGYRELLWRSRPVELRENCPTYPRPPLALHPVAPFIRTSVIPNCRVTNATINDPTEAYLYMKFLSLDICPFIPIGYHTLLPSKAFSSLRQILYEMPDICNTDRVSKIYVTHAQRYFVYDKFVRKSFDLAVDVNV